MDTFVLHEEPISGNCYKIRLTAALLGIPLERRLYSILKGETRTAEFLHTVSSFGRVPVLQVGDSTFLPESNAACFYLADAASASCSSSPSSSPQVNQHEVNIATLRFWVHVIGERDLDGARRVQIQGKFAAGEQALDCMEDHLAKSEHGWFVGDSITLADICLFAYTHLAGDAGFDLARWPAILKWCEQVRQVQGYIPMN
ncbi:Glutathione S-transferase, domain-containing protein [Cladophialophora immunda]|nr:Glutathione S-transferase, domain-containing protein [Cladophialophora immunda]